MDISQNTNRIYKDYPNLKTKIEGYSMILNSFIERTDCNIYEKMVLLSIKKHKMINKSAWPSHKRISNEARCSVSTVKTTIKSLENKGWIEKTKIKNHRSCDYTIKLKISPAIKPRGLVT